MAKRKLSQSIFIALEGIAHAISNERNIKIQSIIGFLVLVIALLLRIPKTDFILIMTVTFLVIIFELINTSLERLIDVLSPRKHDGIGKVKDMMAGAVLLSVILALVVGLLILFRPLLKLLSIA
jgi:diacylglycerol kinase